VIDDDTISAKIITDYLKTAHYTVDTIFESKKAWELLNQHPQDYGLIFIDRMMFGVDGMEFLRRIKHTSSLQHIPVIMFTGEAEPEEHVNAIAAGVSDFIYKPVEKDLLLYLVGEIIKGREIDYE
jgi:DNA-binding response OmpR family regulator